MAGTKSGFLTDPRREYLQTAVTDRGSTYTDSQRIQFEEAITKQAVPAISDLILIARGCETDNVRTVFPPRDVAELVDCILDRVGMEEVAGRTRYYEVILKAVEHRIHEKYREQGRFFKIESSDYPVMPQKPVYKDFKEYTKK